MSEATKKGDRLYFRDQAWVASEDYESLKAALREALDGWEEWLGSKEDADRVEFLRAQFLDDK